MESVQLVIGYMSVRMLYKNKKYKVHSRKVIPTDESEGIDAQCLLKVEKVQRTNHFINNNDQIF